MLYIKWILLFVINTIYLFEIIHAGGVNSVPVVFQVKSLCQVIGGDAEGAAKTQVEFSRVCPGASQVTSLVYACQGNNKEASKIQQECGRAMEGMADAIPVVGHVKGIVHYATGDTTKGDNCMKAATKATIILAAGAVTGGVDGGIALGALAGVSASVTTDAIVGAIDKDENGNYKPQGLIRSVDNIAKGKDVLDSVLEGALDVAGGAMGGVGGVKLATNVPKMIAKAKCKIDINRAFKKALPDATKQELAIAKSNFQGAVKAAQYVDVDKALVCNMKNASGSNGGVGYNAVARGNIAAKNFKNGIKGGKPSINKARNAAEQPYNKPTKFQETNPLAKKVEQHWDLGMCAEDVAAHHILFDGDAIAHTAAVRKVVNVDVKPARIEIKPARGCGNCQQFDRGAVPTDYMKQNMNILDKNFKVPIADKAAFVGVILSTSKDKTSD